MSHNTDLFESIDGVPHVLHFLSPCTVYGGCLPCTYWMGPLCKCCNAPQSSSLLLHLSFFCFLFFPVPQTSTKIPVSRPSLTFWHVFFYSSLFSCPWRCSVHVLSSPDATTAKETSKNQAACGVVPCPRSQSFVDGPSLHETAAAHYHHSLQLRPLASPSPLPTSTQHHLIIHHHVPCWTVALSLHVSLSPSLALDTSRLHFK